MKSWVRGYDGLVRHKEDARVLAGMRILFGFLCAWILLSMLRSGALEAVWLPPQHGGIVPIHEGMWLVRLLAPMTPAKLYGLTATCFVSSLLFMLGLGRMVFGIVSLVTFHGLRSLNPAIAGGHDVLLVNVMLFLVLSDCTRTWSLDCWIRHRRWSSGCLVPAWPRYLIAFQLVILYLATGLKKASLVWTPGGGYSALWYVYMDPTWRRMESVDFMHWAMPFLRLGTAVTWHWEHAAFGLLILGYYRFTRERPGRVRSLVNRYDLRWLWVAVGVAMHVGIWVTMNVGPFSAVTLAMYPALFGPRELEETWNRVSSWPWAGPKPSRQPA